MSANYTQIAEDFGKAYDWLNKRSRHCTNGSFGVYESGASSGTYSLYFLLQHKDEVKCACVYGALAIATDNPKVNLPITVHEQILETAARALADKKGWEEHWATQINDTYGYAAARQLLRSARKLALQRAKEEAGEQV